MNAPSVRLKFLDGLRGVAALMVVLFHQHEFLKLATSFRLPSWADLLLASGHFGIQIFFVLSGFVIAYSIRQADFSWSFWKQFVLKRSIRLDPPYWASLLLMMTATFLFTTYIKPSEQPLFSLKQVLANFFYVHTWLNSEAINPVSWTLCLELQFYLFLISFLTVLNRRSSSPQSTAPLFCACLLLLSLECHQPLLFPFALSTLLPEGLFLPHWYSFFMGCALCWTLIGWIQQKWLFFYLAILSTYALLTLQGDIIATLAFALLIGYVAKKDNLTHWDCSSYFQYLGKISFSLYLIHWLISSNCINFLTKRLEPITAPSFLGIYLFSLACTLAAAHLFHRWIERPCLQWSRSFARLSFS